jgi:hypothetical protein
VTRSNERFVTIRHLPDPVEAEMLKHLLEQEGIAATIQGNTHNAMLGGALGSALQVPLQVLEGDAERATKILAALDEYDSLESGASTAPDELDMNAGDGPYRGAALEDPVPDRKRTVAIAAALIIPLILFVFGAGHFYVRSYARGFALLALAWTSFALAMLGGHRWLLYLMPVFIVLDAAGAVIAINDRARARRSK